MQAAACTPVKYWQCSSSQQIMLSEKHDGPNQITFEVAVTHPSQGSSVQAPGLQPQAAQRHHVVHYHQRHHEPVLHQTSEGVPV